MPRFYINANLKIGMQINLTGNIIKHMNSLRLRTNSSIELFDNSGNAYSANITEFNRHHSLAIIENLLPTTIQRPILIDLAVSIVANDKMDLIIQKTTELGVNNIIPIITSRTQKKHDESLNKKLSRWQNIIISSCEQCGLNLLPQLQPIINLQDLFDDRISNYDLKVILSPKPANYSVIDSSNQSKINKILLLVGPEGGFTDSELSGAVNKNFIPITFGNLIMRTETAVIAGICTLYSKYTNWVG